VHHQNPGTAPPAQYPAQGNSGPIFGQQAIATWDAGDLAPKPTPIIDERSGPNLWLVQVDGPVFIDVLWGTSATKQLFAMRAPARFTVPGRCTVTVYPMAGAPLAAPVEAKASCVPVYGALCCQELRQIFTAAAPTVLPDQVQTFFALTASALTIAGVAVAVPALTRVPIIMPATHDSGTGYWEYSP
jgi:hypothetical protein